MKAVVLNIEIYEILSVKKYQKTQILFRLCCSCVTKESAVNIVSFLLIPLKNEENYSVSMQTWYYFLPEF